MNAGKNEFRLKINRRDLAEIVDLSKQLRLADQAFIKSAPYDDVHAAYYLNATIEFMKNRHVDAGFELVLSE